MHDGVWQIILGFFGLLTVAVLLLPIARRMRFPHTVLLAIAGIGIGLFINLAGGLKLGPISELVHAFDAFSVSSEIIMFLFLPALVFESSLLIDVRKLQADIGPIIFLAIIGLLLSAFAVAGAVYWATGAAFVVCLLLGSIVSATDPVAVVAIFKDLGAPKRLAVLVEGESLFNDATAIVLFTILSAMLIGDLEADLVSGVLDFVKVFLGGVVVGFIMARIFAWVIARISGVPLVEVTLTIVLAYLSFLVAEHYLHVSGVMAVVTAALVTGSYGRTSISGTGWHVLTETWEIIGFWANSLIFILVGKAVPGIMATFTGELWAVLTVLLASAFAARLLLTHLLIPALSRTKLSQEISLGYRTVMWWGGLRGAVSLALALAIYENEAISPDVKSFILPLVCAFVLFTLFVNATTVASVMRAFGLDKLSLVDTAVRDRVLSGALDRVAADIVTYGASHKVDAKALDIVVSSYQNRPAGLSADGSSVGILTKSDWLKFGLTAVAGQERSAYLTHYSAGYIGSEIARELLNQNDFLLDAVKTRGVDGYVEASGATLGFSRQFRLAMFLQRRLGLTQLLARAIASRLERLRTISNVLSDLRENDYYEIESLAGKETADHVGELLNVRAEQVEAALLALRKQYPVYADTLENRFLEKLALRYEAQDYKRLNEESAINSEVYGTLINGIAAREFSLNVAPKLDLGLRPADLVAGVPLFNGLDLQAQKNIADILKPRLAIPGETVVQRGDTAREMYFVSSGALRVDISDTPVVLGSGDFFGELALLRDAPRNANVVAEGFCDLLTLTRSDLERLLNADPTLRRTIETTAAERIAAEDV
jgi:CPA1 family monovalent cation:H+ antiporter